MSKMYLMPDPPEEEEIIIDGDKPGGDVPPKE